MAPPTVLSTGVNSMETEQQGAAVLNLKALVVSETIKVSSKEQTVFDVETVFGSPCNPNWVRRIRL